MTLKEFRSVSAGEKNGPEIFADLYFAEVINFWFETHRLTLAKPTVYNYKKYIPLVKQYFTGALVQKITQEDVLEFLEYLSRLNLKKTSQRNYIKILRMSLKFAHQENCIYHNPCDGVKFPNIKKTDITPFQEEEVIALLSQDAPQWVKDGIVIGFYTGLRPCEIYALRWVDIVFEAAGGYIMVQHSVSRASSDVELKSAKTDQGVRRVDFGRILGNYLKQMSHTSSAYVFPSPTSEEKYRIPWNIAKFVKMMCRESGVMERDFRAIRHTHASVLLKYNVHPKIVQERLGHTDVKITLGVYSHIVPTIQAVAVDVLDTIDICGNK